MFNQTGVKLHPRQLDMASDAKFRPTVGHYWLIHFAALFADDLTVNISGLRILCDFASTATAPTSVTR